MDYSNVDICMLVHNDVRYDGRVLKEAGTLAKQGWRVVVIGMSLSAANIPREETINGFTIVRAVPPFFTWIKPTIIAKYLRRILALPLATFILWRIKAKAYHAHDFPALLHFWVSFLGGKRIVYDSHELYFDRLSMSNFPLFNWLLGMMRPLEKPMARRADAMITVGDFIADHLVETLSLNQRPVVVRNAVDLRVVPDDDFVRFPVSEDKKIIIHTGGLIQGRNLVSLAESLSYLPEDDVLVLMGGDGNEKPNILAVEQRENLTGRIIYVPPVSPFAVFSTIQQAHLAAILTNMESLNNRYALPNKLFESIAAGLPVVVGPNEEIAGIVKRYKMGAVCDPTDPKSLADAIREILNPENYAQYKAGAERASEELHWENEEKVLITLYSNLIGDNGTKQDEPDKT